MPPGIGVDLLFFSGEAAGDGACTEYEKASYSLSGPTVQMLEPTITARACDNEAQRVDDAFYDALFRTGTYAIEGAALRLLNPAGDTLAAFTRGLVPADPTIAPWRLERIAGTDRSSGPVIEGSLPSIRFLPGGRMIGESGCGSFLGSWQVRDSLMTISDVAFRLENCTNDLRDQADIILSTLVEISEFTVRPAGLALEDGAGITRLALVPDIRLAERNWAPTAVLDRNGDVILSADLLRTASVRRRCKGLGSHALPPRLCCRQSAGGSGRHHLPSQDRTRQMRAPFEARETILPGSPAGGLPRATRHRARVARCRRRARDAPRGPARAT